MTDQRDKTIEEFRAVMLKWSKDNGKILNKEEIKLFGAGYFAALRQVAEEIEKAEVEQKK